MVTVGKLSRKTLFACVSSFYREKDFRQEVIRVAGQEKKIELEENLAVEWKRANFPDRLLNDGADDIIFKFLFLLELVYELTMLGVKSVLDVMKFLDR